MVSSDFLAIFAAITTAVHALPAPATTPATTQAPTFPVHLNPTITEGVTVINGTSYPVLTLGGNLRYTLTGGPNSAQGLGGLYIGLQYTQISGRVYPELVYTIEEGDTESGVLPGVGTAVDAGLSTGATTDVLVVGTVGPKLQLPSASGLVGLVTGGFLGEPFTVEGGNAPTATFPYTSGGTFVLGNLASGLLEYGSSLLIGGHLGGSIATAQSLENAGLTAGGSAILGSLGLSANLEGAYKVEGDKTYAQLCIGLGTDGEGISECFTPTPPAQMGPGQKPADVPAAPTPAATAIPQS